MFGPKRVEVTENWIRLRLEELYDLYSPNIIQGDRIKEKEMDGACSTHGREERCVLGFAGVTGVKERLEKPVRR